MSGFICPDCSGGTFKTLGKQLQCELCGWIGENDGSRAWLTDESYEHNARREALVKAGKLFVVRVHYVGDAKERDDDVSATMKLLAITGMGGTDGPTETKYKAEVAVRPTDDVIAKIRKLKTVKLVSIFP